MVEDSKLDSLALNDLSLNNSNPEPIIEQPKDHSTPQQLEGFKEFVLLQHKDTMVQIGSSIGIDALTLSAQALEIFKQMIQSPESKTTKPNGMYG